MGEHQSALMELALHGGFLAALAWSSLAVFPLLRALASDRRDAPLVFALSFTIGPMALAWSTAHLMLLAPGQAPGFYLIAVGLLFGPLGLWGALSAAAPVRQWIGDFLSKAAKAPLSGLAACAFFLALAVVLLMLLRAATTTPVFANDSLEYLQVGRLIAERTSLANYPVVDRAIANGFYAPWTHPPGFVSLIAFGYWFQGHSEAAGVTRAIGPYFAFAQALLVIAFAGRGRLLAGPVAAFLMVATPLYFMLTVQGHIDAMRMAAFAAAMLATWIMAKSPGFRTATLAGLAVGASHYTHSIGLITLGFALPLYALTSQGPMLRRLAAPLWTAALSVSIVATALLKNIQTFGVLLHDSVVLWTYPQLHFHENLAVERGIVGPLQKLVFGALRGFTEPGYFGWSLWILLGAVIVGAWTMLRADRPLLRSRIDALRTSPLGASLILVGGFIAFLALTVAVGTDLAIKNARYALTAQPFVACAVAILLTASFEPAQRTDS